MTAKVVSIFDNPGFFGTCLIGDDDAPPDIIAEADTRHDYHAVLKAELDRVAPEEFLKYARRLATLCFMVYGRATLDLRVDGRDPNGCFNFPPPVDRIPDSVRRIDIQGLSSASFQAIFKRSYSVGLRITQKKLSYPLAECSCALIEWTHLKPDTIFICAYRGPADNLRTRNGQLEDILIRKMFYVSGTAPDMLYSVQLGSDVYTEEIQEH